MKKQKICIIGGSLTGLVTAISLSKLNCEIDLIMGKNNKNFTPKGTIAVSENNLDFLKKMNIFKSLEKNIWPCSVMKLYTEIKNKNISEVFELNNKNKEKKILYMMENKKIIQSMISKIKKIQSIKIENNVTISEITNDGLLQSIKVNNKKKKYNLVIVCTGANSPLVKNYFKDKIIEKSYKESSITTILNHNHLKENHTVRQIFMDNQILALLPISNKKTAVVWSVKKGLKKNDLEIKKKIKFYVKNYLKNISFINKIEYKNLIFLIREKYYKDRTLLFGDALHIIHPFVGQGFNMTLRDLDSLNSILKKKISLGLDIGSSDILFEFSNEIKSRNFAFSISVDILKNSFSINNSYFKKIRNSILNTLNKNDFCKDIFFNIADKGFKF